MHPHAALRPVVCSILLLLVCAWPAEAAGKPEPDYDHWYRVQMMDQTAGWMRTRRVTLGERITTTGHMVLEMRRGTVEISVEMQSEFVETPDGDPVSMRLVQTLGAVPTELIYHFRGDKVLVTTITGKSSNNDEIDAPEGEWLTPVEASSYLRQRLRAEADPVVVRMIDPFSGIGPVTLTRKEFTKESLTLGEREVQAWRCVSTSSAAPGIQSVEYLDERGVPLRTETNFGAIRLTMELADSDVTDQLDAPEFMVSTFVTPDRPIQDPRSQRKLAFTLTIPEGQALPDLPETSVQRVERLAEHEVRVTLDLDNPRPAPRDEAANPVYLQSSTATNLADPMLWKLGRMGAMEAGEEQPDEVKIEGMRRFANELIQEKSLNVAFATATEVSRSLEGDCTEHAVLLAGMLKGYGIPARVASGLVYVEEFAGEQGIFGFHMWTQALVPIDGTMRWIDLDATLPDDTPFTATHIAVFTSSLDDQEGFQPFAALAPLLGQLEITVEQPEDAVLP